MASKQSPPSATQLDGRVVVITGAAGGIGEAAARLCVKEGARVFLVDRDSARLKSVADSLGEAAWALTADVAEADTAARYVSGAQVHFGKLDVAMLNAGTAGRISPIEKITVEDFDDVMRVNVRSVWSGLAALFPAMRANGGGSIVVTASTGGLLGAPQVAPYIASKHAVIGLVKSAAIEGARDHIRVNAVAPAPIDTPMMAQINQGLGAGDAARSRSRTIAHVPMGRYGTAEEVANMMLFLASDQSSYSTGGVYLLDGGMAAGIYP
jgi:NAD(P)-dependent dehydrogenase (short-subunit alcohol dehydrogenase family)